MNTALHIAAGLVMLALAFVLEDVTGDGVTAVAALAVGLVFLLPLAWFALQEDLAILQRRGKS